MLSDSPDPNKAQQWNEGKPTKKTKDQDTDKRFEDSVAQYEEFEDYENSRDATFERGIKADRNKPDTNEGIAITYFSDEEDGDKQRENEEIKNEELEMSSKQEHVEKVDFVKDVFAKFGLSTDLYTSATVINREVGRRESKENEVENSKEQRVRKFLERLPEYGFLSETKLSLPQEFFA